jgi:hypothetical protein
VAEARRSENRVIPESRSQRRARLSLPARRWTWPTFARSPKVRRLYRAAVVAVEPPPLVRVAVVVGAELQRARTVWI